MIFLTVGTYPLPFDRLVKAVDDGVAKGIVTDEIYGQIGCSKYLPKSFKYVRMLDKNEYDEHIGKSKALISHAGMGSISMALDYGKPLLAFPRLARYKEMVNDHQLDTAMKFEEMGFVLAAYDEQQLWEKIPMLKTFVPKQRIPTPERVAARVKVFLQKLGV